MAVRRFREEDAKRLASLSLAEAPGPPSPSQGTSSTALADREDAAPVEERVVLSPAQRNIAAVTRRSIKTRAEQVEDLSAASGPALYTLAELSEKAGIPRRLVHRFWIAMGFPDVRDEDTDVVFTDADVKAMASFGERVADGRFSERRMASFLRGHAHFAERLLQWQLETAIDLTQEARGLDPIGAREYVVNHFGDYEVLFSNLETYTRFRHLGNLLERTRREVETLAKRSSKPVLKRAIGFVDLVSFTSTTRRLSQAEFVRLIEEFDRTCRDIIASRGGRLVKTIGDAFLWVADEVVIGADIATSINEALGNNSSMPPVRSSLTWGPIVARFGDVFGSSVNLASRLADAADPGSVLISEKAAELLDEFGDGRYRTSRLGEQDLQGFGSTPIYLLERC